MTLGVRLDAARTFEELCQQRRESVQLPHGGLCHIRRCITRDAANTLAAYIVGTRLDYCNSLFYCIAKKSLNKLQIVQNKCPAM